VILKGSDYTVILTRQGGYPWTGNAFLQIKGFDNDGGTIYDSARENFSPEQWEDYLQNLNGHATVVLSYQGCLFVASDYLRTFPLFYSIQNKHFYLSDDVHSLPEGDGRAPGKIASLCFDTLGYTLGRETLSPHIFQMNAGESLRWSRGSLQTEIYYDYRRGHSPLTDKDAFFKKAKKAAQETGDRLAKNLQGRKALVPLSGGYDSRLVLCFLKECGYENVMTYTYGSEESFEVQIASRAAQNLGYPWVRIPLDKEIYNCYRDEILQYLEYGGQYAAQPTLYDFVALKHGQKTGMLPHDAVFVPGHVGSLLKGHYLPKLTGQEAYTADDAARHVYKIFGQFKYLFSKAKKQRLLTMIRNEVLGEKGNEEWYCMAAQTWNCRFRQSRLIVNGLRHAEFLNFPWLIPLWDSALGQEWYEAVPSLRRGDAPWREFIRKTYFIPMKVDFPRGNPNMNRRPKGGLIKHLPLEARQFYKVVRGRMSCYPDVNNYAALIELLHREAQTRPSPFADHYGRMFEASRKIMTEKGRHGKK